MKKLSEFKADRIAAKKAYRDRCQAVLADIAEKAPELHGNIELRDQMRDGLRTARLPLMGIACDHCNTELVNRKPGLIAASKPPKKHIGCPGCGWTGYFSVR